MATSTLKGGLDGEQNPWGSPPIPDLLTDEHSPQESPDEPPEQPPQYSDARSNIAGPSTSATILPQSPLPIPNIPFDLYRIPEASESPDQNTITSKYPPFQNESDTLFTFLNQQIGLPPKPTLHVTGKHKSRITGTVTDFDLKLNLTSLLYRPEAQQWNYLKFARKHPS